MAKPSPRGRCPRHLSLAMSVTVLCMACQLTAQQPPDQAMSLAMQQGAQAMESGNFAAAVEAYTTATRLAPEFAEGYLNLGLASFQAGQLDHARTALEKALKLKPGLRGANLFLGILAYRQNRLKDAEMLLARETHLDPHSAKAFMWLGVCRLAENDPQQAIAALDKAYALDPKDVDILYHRGRAYLLMANQSYAAMFSLDHDSARVHQVLGEAYAEAHRNEEAAYEFKIAVEMAPAMPGLHEELGDQDWIAAHPDLAAADYRKELEIDPYSGTTMYKLGCLLVRTQNPAEGVQFLRQALKADPSLSDAHYFLGDGLMALADDRDAIGEFRQAIAADPANDRAISAYYKLAQIYRKLHDEQNAHDAMQIFLRMKAENQARHDSRVSTIVHKRTELPVADPEPAAATANTQ
jgi:tetratricopeptide (TPR) repeat protein